MKDLKKKLTAAGAMLVVSAVMLSGVSYAWYTLSTNPEVKGMKTTVVANENLEIALEKTASENEDAVNGRSKYEGDAQGSKSGNYYTWGNLVDLTTAFNTLNTDSKLQIRPVKYNNGTLQFPKYGEDGRVASLDNLKTNVVRNDTEKDSVTGGVYGWAESNTNPTDYYAYQVNYWLRSNVAGNVSLSTAAKRANDGVDTTTTGVNGVSGTGSWIKVTLSETAAGTQQNAEKTKVDEYLQNLKIKFVAGDTSVDATIPETGTLTNGVVTYDITAANITALTANNAQLVKMYVYLDGETVKNADALLNDLSDVQMNIQFDNAALQDDAMAGTTSGN